MAEQANIFAFSPVIKDTLTHKHIGTKNYTQKNKTDDGERKNIVSCLLSVHNIISSRTSKD